MYAKILRLAAKFKLSLDEATALYQAGLDTPAKVKAAGKGELEKAVGKETAKRIRQ